MTYSPFIWVLVTLPILLLLERWIHRHLRGLALLITGRQDWSVYIYALVLLPGVFLHEFSHWISARLLGVRTGNFSVFPRQQEDGSLQLGYVEYYRDASLGPVRESLIGAAPLIFGITVVSLIGRYVFQIPDVLSLLNSPDLGNLIGAIEQMLETSDLFIWLYLLFAVSNAMMPSPSDRRAWPMLGVVIGTAVVVLLIFGQTGALLDQMVAPFASICVYVTLAFVLTILVDILFIIVIWLMELIFGRLSGRRINYS